LAELGHPTRLGVYRYLVKMGSTPVVVGDVQQALGVPASTLSHHLGRLARVGLIRQRREGRVLYCEAQYDKLQTLLDFLTDECCEGQACLTSTRCCD